MEIGDRIKFIKNDWECLDNLINKTGTIIAESRSWSYDFEIKLDKPLSSGSTIWTARKDHLKVINKDSE